MFGSLPRLSKQYVEDNVDQVAVMAYYLGISSHTIDTCISRNKLICSPLRADDFPTAGFYVNHSGKLRFNDFGGFFHGDMYAVVGYRTLLDPDDPHEFMLILRKICQDFNLWYYAIKNTSPRTLMLDKIPELKPKQYTEFEVQQREWSSEDTRYWKKYRLDEATVTAAFIFPVYAAWINNRLVYSDTRKDPCYAIYHGELNGQGQWKLYFPKRSTGNRDLPRFLTNTRRMQNMGSVKEAPFGIITKAIKDALVLNINGVQATALSAESITPSDAELQYLRSKWGTIYSLLDFDYAGIKMANHLRKKCGIQPFFLTTGNLGTFDYRAKDISDFSDVHSPEKATQLINLVVDCKGVIDRYFYDELSNFLTPF